MRTASVCFADMKMSESSFGKPYGVGDRIFLYIHVESIKHRLYIRLVYRLYIVNIFISFVYHISFKAVERFHADRDAVIRRHIGKLSHAVYTALSVRRFVKPRFKINRPVRVQRSADAVDAGNFHFAEHIGIKIKSLFDCR